MYVRVRVHELVYAYVCLRVCVCVLACVCMCERARLLLLLRYQLSNPSIEGESETEHSTCFSKPTYAMAQGPSCGSPPPSV